MGDAPKREVIDALNAFLKGEHMAIRSYNDFVYNLHDGELKKELQSIQMDHKEHAADIVQRIQEMGGQPQEGTGLAGFMAGTMMEVAELTGQGDLDILERAYDGEDIGIDSASKIVQGNLDQESEELIRRILSDEHDHLKTLKNLISTYEKSK